MKRVTLRQWLDDDLDAFAALNADAEVMRFFPSLLSREQSEAFIRQQQTHIAKRGWGYWAVDVDGQFAGFTGLGVPSFDAAFMPCVEVGWRLAKAFWGEGVGFRAATMALNHGFSELGLTEVVAFTARINMRSVRLMERLGFVRDVRGDFVHPRIGDGHELSYHVLYRKQAEAHRERTATSSVGKYQI